MNDSMVILGTAFNSAILVAFAVVQIKVNTRSQQIVDMFKKVKGKVEILYDWHDKEDENGTKLWYVPRNFAKIQIELSKNMTLMAQVLDALQKSQDRATLVSEKILEEIREMDRKSSSTTSYHENRETLLIDELRTLNKVLLDKAS